MISLALVIYNAIRTFFMNDCELVPIFALLWSNAVGFSFICVFAVPSVCSLSN